MTGPGVLAAGAVRRRTRRRAAARPGPQAHRRGRHRPEHRRDGRLRAGPGAVRRRRAAGDVRAAGARPLRRRRDAVRRRALRRADADRRRPAAGRVQRAASATPRRRPCSRCSTSDLAELALAVHRRASSPPTPLEIAPGAACTVVAAAPGYPAAPVARRADQVDRLSRHRVGDSSSRSALAVPGRRWPTAASPAGGCSPSPGSAPTSPPPAPPPTRRWPAIRFDGMQVRRDIGWRAPGADARRRTPPPASTSTRATAPSPR